MDNHSLKKLTYTTPPYLTPEHSQTMDTKKVTPSAGFRVSGVGPILPLWYDIPQSLQLLALGLDCLLLSSNPLAEFLCCPIKRCQVTLHCIACPQPALASLRSLFQFLLAGKHHNLCTVNIEISWEHYISWYTSSWSITTLSHFNHILGNTDTHKTSIWSCFWPAGGQLTLQLSSTTEYGMYPNTHMTNPQPYDRAYRLGLKYVKVGSVSTLPKHYLSISASHFSPTNVWGLVCRYCMYKEAVSQCCLSRVPVYRLWLIHIYRQWMHSPALSLTPSWHFGPRPSELLRRHSGSVALLWVPPPHSCPHSQHLSLDLPALWPVSPPDDPPPGADRRALCFGNFRNEGTAVIARAIYRGAW